MSKMGRATMLNQIIPLTRGLHCIAIISIIKREVLVDSRDSIKMGGSLMIPME